MNRPLTVVKTEAGQSSCRKALARARQARGAASTVLAEAIAAFQRAEKLIAAPEPLRAKIADLEAAAGRVVETWAKSGSVTMPPLPGGDDLDGFRRELVEAERVAEAARLALPALRRNADEAQASVQEALVEMRGAIAAILVEHSDELVEELTEHERRAAVIRGDLRALQHHFQLEGVRGNRFSPALQDQVRRKIPERIAASDAEIQRRVSHWTSFAERLLGDDQATSETGENANVAA